MGLCEQEQRGLAQQNLPPATHQSRLVESLVEHFAAAPREARMSSLEMIQTFGAECIHRFPAKHELNMTLPDGLRLSGYSDTWLDPPTVRFALRGPDGVEIPEQVCREFEKRTGRALLACVLSEVQRRLAAGECPSTINTELCEIMREPASAAGLARTEALLSKVVGAAAARDWSPNNEYTPVLGEGYHLDLDEEAGCPVFSLLKGAAVRLAVVRCGDSFKAVVGTAPEPCGRFIAKFEISGPGAKQLHEEMMRRIDGLQQELAGEKAMLQSGLENVVSRCTADTWRLHRTGCHLGVTGRVGAFNLRFEAPILATFAGISILHSQVRGTADGCCGPCRESIVFDPSAARQAVEKILSGAEVALCFCDDQESERFSVLSERVHAVIRASRPEHWHDLRDQQPCGSGGPACRLADARYSLTLAGTRDPAPGWGYAGQLLVSPSGVSIGQRSASLSSGFQEGMLCLGPVGQRLAEEAIKICSARPTPPAA